MVPMLFEGRRCRRHLPGRASPPPSLFTRPPRGCRYTIYTEEALVTVAVYFPRYIRRAHAVERHFPPMSSSNIVAESPTP